ncbi:MAM and LDL-receptor class A domain-containing protein 1-like [Saccoglossus kowalevskii]
MYGVNIGQLNVYITNTSTPDEPRLIWNKDSDQGNRWHFAQVTVYSPREYYISIEGIKGDDTKGDIAIDDLHLSAGACPETGHCNFEKNMCGWQNVPNNQDDFDWMWNSGSRPSAYTGPITDYTTGTAYGWYMFVETAHSSQFGTKAEFISEHFKLGRADSCLMFAYSMYGKGAGDLYVYYIESNNPNNRELIFSAYGNQGVGWKRAQIDIHSTVEFQIVFEGHSQFNGIAGYIAIDDIELHQNTNCEAVTCDADEYECRNGSCIYKHKYCDFRDDCPQGEDEAECPTVCNFENRYCGWSLDPSSTIPWTMKTGPIEDPDSTLPEEDNTLKTAEGHYIYVESDGTEQSARIVSPTFSLAGTECQLELFYHYVTDLDVLLDIGTIRAYLVSGSLMQRFWSLEEQVQNEWTQQIITVPRCSNYFQIILEADMKFVTDFFTEGHIALDDISFLNCSYEEVPADCDGLQTCSSGHCYSDSETCDFQMDCCIGYTDESTESCDGYEKCDFEDETYNNGWCTWEQLTYDQFDWTRQNGEASVVNTGPSFDHTTFTSIGYYIYIDTSNILPGDKARLASHVIDAVDEDAECSMRFYYHMYGLLIGSLNIYTWTERNGELTLLWSEQDDHGDRWIRDEIQLISDKPFEVVIEGVEGELVFGDIALDDITFTPGCIQYDGELPIGSTAEPTTQEPGDGCLPLPGEGPLFQCDDGSCVRDSYVCDYKYQCVDASDESSCPVTCTYEDDDCGWSEQIPGDNFDWVRSNYRDVRPGASAPQFDHTLGTDEGYYMYVDMSADEPEEQVAEMKSSVYSETANNCTLEFWFYMDEPLTGFMTLHMLEEDGTETEMWRANFPRGAKWNWAIVGFHRRRTNYELIFRKIRQFGYGATIAVDDISFNNCALPDPDQSCDTVSGDYWWCPGDGLTNGACISSSLLCDINDDCGDNSDEFLSQCSEFRQCDFESDFCDWVQGSVTDNIDWTRQAGGTLAPYTGPSFDHTKGNSEGFYIFLDSGFPSHYHDRADLIYNIVFKPTTTGTCKV